MNQSPEPLELSDIVRQRLILQCFPISDDAAKILQQAGAKGVLNLLAQRSAADTYGDHSQIYRNLRQLTKNNCQVLILNGRSAFAVYKKKYFWASNVEYVLIPTGMLSVLLSVFINRYQKHRLLVNIGKVELKSTSAVQTYHVYQVPRRLLNNRKVFAPPNLTGTEILASISNVDYVLLRAFERIETGGEYKDLDLLVSDEESEKLRQIFGTKIGTEAMDVYTANGTQGHDFNTVPYFLPKLAHDTLASVVVRSSGIRAPSPKYAYLTFLYHLLFHGKSKNLPPDLESINSSTFETKHTTDLEKLSSASGYPFPTSLEYIETLLRDEGYFPGRDLIAFYAKNNRFVTERYLKRNKHKPGLSTFFVRRFPDQPDQVETVKQILVKNFSIVDQGRISIGQQEAIMASVRGGNWYDRSQNADAPPIYWFVCYDHEPVPPHKKMLKRYPHLDNAKNATLKLELRSLIKDHRGHPLRFVHASDNTDEALEHIAALQLSDRADLLEHIKRLEP